MISCPEVRKQSIRFHYDLTTPFYRLFWGQHIHHGYWQGNESPQLAQENLIRQLATEAGIERGSRVLDVGCGMGGSSRALARDWDCHVTGVTLSGLQRRYAAMASRWHGLKNKTRFLRADAEQVEFPTSSFDAVWSVECTEHLFDKPRFFQRVAGWLKPGGRVAICAWLASEAAERRQTAAAHQSVQDVCEGFLCPSLGTMEDYRGWMLAAGFKEPKCLDWTEQTWQTWQICLDRVKKSRVRHLARFVDRETALFLDRFETILHAYRSGAMQYGCISAALPREGQRSKGAEGQREGEAA